MNRKLIVAAIGFVVAVAIGSHFYVEWQMAKFDASLPTPPTEEQLGADETVEDVIEESGGETTGGHWHGDEWHAEPHPAPEPAKPPRPFEVFVTAEELPRTSTGKEPAQPKRPDIWADDDRDFPPEGAPRPLKHLNALELHNFSLAPDLTDAELIQVQSEFFFRYVTKEQRDELRQQRVRNRVIQDFNKAYDEQRRVSGSAD